MPFWTSPEGGEDGKSKQIAYNDPTVRYVVQYLESHLDTIREEYLRVAPTLPSDYDESMGGHSKDTLHSGTWDWHSYMNKGGIQGHFCTHFPKTSEILHQGLRQRTEANGGLVPSRGKESDEEHLYPHLLFEGTPFGFCFFSTLSGKSKIQAHTAPMNLRLRLHVPLIVPSNTANGSDRPVCGIRVGPFVREWKEGSVMVLDDAYNHEVWNDTDEARVILLVDIWHPDIPAVEKKAIVDLFQKAQKDGLWKR
jgi:Aspartyl/Asparaginyl beta-hydroxylase